MGRPNLKVHQVLKCVKSPPLVGKRLDLPAHGNKLNTKKVLVVLECLKDRAFVIADCLRSLIIMPLVRSLVEC